MGCKSSKEKSDDLPSYFVSEFLSSSSLRESTTAFLDEIFDANYEEYLGLVEQLNFICDTKVAAQDKVKIKPHHFDIVVELLNTQRQLAPNIDELIARQLVKLNFPLDDDSRYLKSYITSLFQNLRLEKLPAVIVESASQNYTHHSLNHGVELKVRAMNVITRDLQLYCSDSVYDLFMRNIVSLAIECHDYIQGKPSRGYRTPEEESALLVVDWLRSLEIFAGFPDALLTAIQFQVLYIVSIGTTIAFSVNNPLSLLSLSATFERAMQKSGIVVYDESNRGFCQQTKLIANVVSCFDTIPCSMLSAVKRQANIEKLNSGVNLDKYSQATAGNPLLIQQFLVSRLQSCYLEQINLYQAQAFLIGIIPKLGMCIEFANTKEFAESARICGKFIRHFQRQYKHSLSAKAFFEEFEREFQNYTIADKIAVIFMNSEQIGQESSFCRSQYSRATEARVVLDEYLATKVGVFVDEIIVPEAVLIDAENIRSFFAYYLSLSQSDKEQLLKELVLNLILQAGELYLQHPELEELFESALKIDAPVLPQSEYTWDEINTDRSWRLADYREASTVPKQDDIELPPGSQDFGSKTNDTCKHG